MAEIADCLIVGGGPAGLTAAIYLARFHLSVRLVDAGQSRASQIPCTRNLAGFPGGIAGRDLINLMQRQAIQFGAELTHGRIERLLPVDAGFRAETDSRSLRARTVLLATGVTNHAPAMSPDLHTAALAAGRLRYCPVCDGFEVTDREVAVIGTGARGVKEALFLRSYTARVTLISNTAAHELTPAERGELAALRHRSPGWSGDGFCARDVGHQPPGGRWPTNLRIRLSGAWLRRPFPPRPSSGRRGDG